MNVSVFYFRCSSLKKRNIMQNPEYCSQDPNSCYISGIYFFWHWLMIIYIVTCLLKAGIAEPEKTPVAREWPCKHVTTAIESWSMDPIAYPSPVSSHLTRDNIYTVVLFKIRSILQSVRAKHSDRLFQCVYFFIWTWKIVTQKWISNSIWGTKTDILVLKL
jgi:hypothetical protein